MQDRCESFAVEGRVQPGPGVVEALLAREVGTYVEQNAGSEQLQRASREVLVSAVASSFQSQTPFPVYLAEAAGAVVWDVDGNERADFHNGFGSMVQGHAHPDLVSAIEQASRLGTHTGATGWDATAVADELAARWRLPQWRFATSGSEATMDAIRLARAATGRSVVVKMFGAYHGHHDAVLVSTTGADHGEESDRLPSVPASLGIPDHVVRSTAAVPFNDADALRSRLSQLQVAGSPAACVIVEPIFQMGVLVPLDGYLARVREVCDDYGALLIFDEVKSGFAVGRRGWTAQSGVQPDIVTLGKALGGGTPVSAVGATSTVFSTVATGSVLQAGTFNGNALGMAVARRNLETVLTEQAYEELTDISSRHFASCREALLASGLAGHGARAGARGFFALSAEAARDHRDVAQAHPADLGRLAWFYLMNRGVYTTPARPFQWVVGLAHGDAELARYASAFADFLSDLSRS